MYQDEDGVATKQSQAVYEGRIRLLIFMACFLSFEGFGAAVLNGEYAQEKLLLPVTLNTSDPLEYRKWLWVSQEFLN
jgi:hypothetical protein